MEQLKQEARNKAVFDKHIKDKFTIITVTIDDLTVPARYETLKAPERYGDVEAYEQRLREGILNVAVNMLYPEPDKEVSEDDG